MAIMQLLLKNIEYEQHKWQICVHLKAIFFSLAIQNISAFFVTGIDERDHIL